MSDGMEYRYDVFISYSHQDTGWVHEQLLSRLEDAGLRVCIDARDFAIGRPILENIESAVDNSLHTLIVLTPAWVASEWTDFESLLAGTSDPAARRRKIIPLMLGECKPPARIATLTWADFKDPEQHEMQFHRLLSQLKTISSTSASRDDHSEAKQPQVSEMSDPLPPVSKQIVYAMEWPYGTLAPTSAFYVNRQADRECQNHFNPGRSVTVYIQAPRQMGKSSLMLRTCHWAEQADKFRTVYIDFDTFSTNQMYSLDEFLKELCYRVSEQLDIPEAVDEYWVSGRRARLV